MPFSGRPTDYCILTMREDEFLAVLDRLGSEEMVTGASGRHYAVGEVTANSQVRRIAVARCPQGNLESARAAREIVEDLAPDFVFLCGIAGGIPSADYGLGDVVLGDRIVDFTVSAANTDGTTSYSTSTARPEKVLFSLLEILPALRLTDWAAPTALEATRPQEWGDPIAFTSAEIEKKWLPDVEKALAAMRQRTAPICKQAPIGSSDALMKDPERLLGLLSAHRNLCAVEMEAAGVMAVMMEKRLPFLVVRGLSDVVGVKRLGAWTPYACATAASYLLALLTNAQVDRLLHPQEPNRHSAGEPAKSQTGAKITPAMLTQKLDAMHEYEVNALINIFLERQPWKAVRRDPLGTKINDFVEWAQKENVLAEAYAWQPSPSP